MADARKDKRTLLSLRIRYKSATLEEFIERYSSDISRGGVFIKAKKPLAVGTLLKFEFILQDHSTLIHGVGRVVWRREEAEADPENPPGMGIKFIKMDSESRAVVQRIAEDRGRPGVFEHGKGGARPAPDRGGLAEADPAKVRHVSEFLASALEEGRAGDVVTREAQAGAERARQIGNPVGEHRAAAARGAFSAHHELPTKKRDNVSDSPSRGAMSAFGGAGMSASASASMGSAAAPAINELNAEDDFLDDETTKIRDFMEYDHSEADGSESDYPDADPTVITAEAASAFTAEKRVTPVVAPASTSPLHDAVPDLFGYAASDSSGPASGEPIGGRLLDAAVATAPRAGAPVPDAPGIPAEAFKIPQAPQPVWTMRPTPEKPRSRGWMLSLLFGLFLASGALAAWQLGLMDGWMDSPAPAPAARPEEASIEPQLVEEAIAVDEIEPAQAAEPVVDVEDVELAPVEAVEISVVKFEILSRPVGAFVSVDGKGVGRTPLELEYEAGTKLSLFSKARGYLPRRQQITVEADQAPVKLWLAPLPYVVQVITNPAGARASAVGGGEVTTPGALKFKSMPGSRDIVVSMDGYKTATKSVAREDFTEETRRMAATVNVTLRKDEAAGPTQPASSDEAAAPPPSEAKAEPSAEPSAKPTAEPSAEPPPAPKAVEEPPAPTSSETTAADVP